MRVFVLLKKRQAADSLSGRFVLLSSGTGHKEYYTESGVVCKVVSGKSGRTRVLREYSWDTGKLDRALTLMVVGDLHNEPYDDILPMLKGADALLIPGDLSDRYRQRFERGIAFLREASAVLPTFVSIGNHDLKQQQFPRLLQAMRESGAVILCNDWVPFKGIVIGGWYNRKDCYEEYGQACLQAEHPQLEGFYQQECVRVMLCHKPEQFAESLASLPIDLTVAGHAHGGQIRIKGQGLYAPGQGLLPKLTAGSPMKGLLITAGAGNPAKMPRWGNPREVLRITLR